MQTLEQLEKKAISFIEEASFDRKPTALFEPVEYAMKQGGKRIRPLLVLIAADMFSFDLDKAKYPALAVELLHNFTLVHDDIMDASPLRRGKPTVYQKYGTNRAILSGDVIYAMAYEQLINCDADKIPALTKTLTSVLINVCQGQAYDMAFENTTEVSVRDYITMISLKTGILLAGSLKLGAIVADASKENMNVLSEIGLYLGIAFQLQDDLLDCWSDLESFGKVSGTDIADNKKTILYLLTLENANEEDAKRLLTLYSGKPADVQQKIQEVKSLFEKYDAKQKTEDMVNEYMNKALKSVESLDVEQERKSNIVAFIQKLLNRKK
ncbi:MAG: polyprenyl synthetase family protein [Bacteroidales bacterium]|nr:polyprenyl synthetase family protein [Bacteroidales bacterium]